MNSIVSIARCGISQPAMVAGTLILLVAGGESAYAQQRVTQGLLALYEFSEPSGDVVQDSSGVGRPLNLRIEKLDAVRRLPGQLEIRDATVIRSSSAATKIIDSVKRRGELSVEAWMKPANTTQDGPARIVSLSKDSSLRNFTLGQDGRTFDLRLRTTGTGENGVPSLATGDIVSTNMTHVVYTRARSGQAVIYVDGREIKSGRVSGSVEGWDSSFQLALANELSQDRPWRGIYELVAVYGRALSTAEVKQNFAARPAAPAGDEPEPQTESFVASHGNGSRVGNGVQLLYDFRGGGNVVKDRSGLTPAIDLKIEKPNSVRFSEGSLQVRGETIIRSEEPPRRLIEAVRRSGQLTIEAWVSPAKTDQSGPARIVTLSRNGNERNFTLGQDGNAFDVRMRTTKTSTNGIPSTPSSKNEVKPRMTHVVYTRDRGGNARVYVNGRQTGQKQVAGAVSNWDDSYRFALANEFSGDRQWLGTYHLVAIYSRHLGSREVLQNFRAGPDSQVAPRLAENRESARAHFFETKIAPLLSTHCLECHDTASREGELDLSRPKAAFAGGESGDAIVPGKLKESLVWQSVLDDTMPHDRPPLTAKEKELLKAWILDGAHWSVPWIDPAIYKLGRGSENWVRRLTIPEYIATVKAAVGVDISSEAHQILPPDQRADGFSNTSYNLGVDFEHVDAYARLAELIVQKMDVAKFTSRFTRKKRLIDDDMRGLVGEMGKWILRGPLDEREVVDFRGITTSVASAGGSFDEAAGYVIQAMLQSPRFIYRIENQRGDGATMGVDAYELASRMSYILWGAPPDQELYQAAESGDLYDLQVVKQQVARMLEDPRAMDRSRQFVYQWLDLGRLDNLQPDKEMFPKWNAGIAADMREETLAFFHEVVWQQKRPLSHLLNAQVTFATPGLAKHYGMKSQGDKRVKYDLSSVPSRGGLLTQGSLLTIGGDDASMVTRGLFVLNDLLFSEVGDPPPGLDTTPVPPSPGKSHRAIATERIESTACGGCHSRFEPLAFGLEKYDGLGTFHEVDEHGNRLREDGEILFPGEANPVQYKTAAQLMDLLAQSPRVGECLTRKVTQFAIGRPLVAGDARTIRQIHQQAKRDGGTYAATITAVVLSDLVQKTQTERE